MSEVGPVVSIVIPARNEEADLPAALQSIADQDFDLRQVEVVVVDGDSVDGTAEVAASILGALPLARCAVLPNAGGNTPSNLNRGLEWAAGEYVVRVDARSQIPADYLRRVVEVLRADPSVAVAGGSQVAIARSGDLLDSAIAGALNNPVAMGGSRYRRSAASGPADTVYLGAFRRLELVEAGGWNEHFSTNQDFELNRRIGADRTIWFESELPVHYLPRRSISQLFHQYHRFGRWKAHYWSHTGNPPQVRQFVLLAVPPIGAALSLFAGRQVARTVPVVGSVALAGATATGFLRIGAGGILAWAINVVIGFGWWTGVVRGLLRDDVA